MALPAAIDPTAPANTDSPGDADDQIRALKLFIADVFGLVTSPTTVTAALFSTAAGGYLNAGTTILPAVKVGGATTGMWSASAGVELDWTIAGETRLSLVTTAPTYLNIDGTDAGANGPAFRMSHLSASPADGDIAGFVQFFNRDDGANAQNIAAIWAVHDDVSIATQDSSIYFSVQNNVNAGGANTAAFLSSLGVWTDASDEAQKEYIGDIVDVTGKLKQLTTLGVYRGKSTPSGKLATAERHYSPTAQDFFSVFGLGNNPARGHKGIAPKDVGWLAVKFGLELDARIAALEAKVP